MLRKLIIVIGLCFVALVGCGEDIPAEAPAPDPVAIQKQQRVEQERIQLVEQERLKQEQENKQKQEQERVRLAAEQERENKRQEVLSNIRQLEQQSSLLSQKMIGRQNNISKLEEQQNQLVAELREYDGNVKSFMLDHKMAVGCMGVVGVSLDKNNHYAEDAEKMAAGAAIACGFAVLADDNFRKEVFSVADQLAQVSANEKNIKSQLNEVQSQLATENESLANEKLENDKLVSDIQNYQSQLASV